MNGWTVATTQTIGHQSTGVQIRVELVMQMIQSAEVLPGESRLATAAAHAMLGNNMQARDILGLGRNND
jgi:hypothetical protein